MLFSFEQFSLVSPFRFVRFKSSRGGMWIASLCSQWRVWGHWIATLPFGRSQWRKKGESSFEGRDEGAIFVGRLARGRDEGAIFCGRLERGRDKDAVFVGRSARGRDKYAIFVGRSARGRDKYAIFVGRSARGRDKGKIEKAPLYPLLTDEGTRNNHLFSLFSRGGMWIATLCSQWRVWGHWIATLCSQWRGWGYWIATLCSQWREEECGLL